MFRVQEILKATKGKLMMGVTAAQAKGISIDTKTLKRGELFIAIKGKNHDGHEFISHALKKGANGVMVASKRISPPNIAKLCLKQGSFIISVENTKNALMELAGLHRQKFDIPAVAVTGSSGKTSTKEMTESVLRGEWRPLKNPGTQNNTIGIPLTLLKLSGRYKSLVVELGMNRAGEIKRLSEIARPNIGVITNIGPSHLEFLKNFKGVYRAKKELLDFLGKGDIAILNNDDVFLRHFRNRKLRIVTFGINKKSDFQAKKIRRKKEGWAFTVNGKLYCINLAPYRDIYNALAAIAIGVLFNVGYTQIKSALSGYKSLEKRMSPSMFRGMKFIDDSYNSNPLSLKNAIDVLKNYKTKGGKTLVSGDMMELGEKARYYHENAGRLVAHSGIDNFIAVGPLMRHSFLAAKKCGMKNAWFCSSKKEAVSLLKKILRAKDVILIKGSRAMQMEDTITSFIASASRRGKKAGK